MNKGFPREEKIKKEDAFIALEKIKEAETNAKKLIIEAKEKVALEIVKRANEEAQKMKEDHFSLARKKAEEKRWAIIEKAREEAQKIREDTEKEIKEIQKRASLSMDEAIGKVAERILSLMERGW